MNYRDIIDIYAGILVVNIRRTKFHTVALPLPRKCPDRTVVSPPMRGVFVVITVLCVALTAAASAKPAARPADLTSPDNVLRWINGYRQNPDPANVPAAIRALSSFGALNDPEKAGVYVGFLAGVLLAN